MLDEGTAISEFCHRVANDLALVMAFPSGCKEQMHVLSTGEIFEEAIEDVASFSLLYRQLHERPADDDFVDVVRHLTIIGGRMDASYLSGLGIAFLVNAPVALAPSALAHELGLIVIELVTNAARHAEHRRIGIKLSTDKDRWICCVADDGVGLPQAVSAPARGGLNYVRRLAE